MFKDKNYFNLLLVLILITLPLGGFAINSSAVILLVLFSIYRFIKKRKIKFDKVSVILVSIFILSALSLFWTSNIENTHNGIIRFLSYLVIPICFVSNSDLEVKREKILNIFSKFLVCYAFYGLVIALINSIKQKDIKYIFYHNLSFNVGDLNAIYLSVFVAFSMIFYAFKKRKTMLDKFSLGFLYLFLVLLSSKMIISISSIILLIYFLKTIKFKNFNYKYIVLVFSFLIVFILASTNLFKRFEVELEKTKIQEVLTKKDFGHAYLWTGAGLRAFQTKAFIETLSENKKVLLGFGLNNSQESLNNKYKEYNLYPGFLNYNYHNQYIQIFAELGIVGLSLLLIVFFFLFRQSIIYKDYFLLCFIILILVVSFTESFLWRQRGMIFFITISLLLTKKKIIETKKININ